MLTYAFEASLLRHKKNIQPTPERITMNLFRIVCAKWRGGCIDSEFAVASSASFMSLSIPLKRILNGIESVPIRI